MRKGIINIKIPPIEKEEVFVTKSIRDGKKIIFEIMVYNKDGLLVPKNISYQDLVLKAPYALIKYYESKIIYWSFFEDKEKNSQNYIIVIYI